MTSAYAATKIIQQGRRAVAQRVRVYGFRASIGETPETMHQFGQQVLRVGSASQGNDLVLESDTVSRYHFELVLDELGFRLRDLGSTNGTFVDGVRALDVYLRAGATVQVGGARLVFEPTEREADVALSAEDSFGPLVGRSAPMRHLFSILERVAPTDATVLVEGESGTGKELVATALHQNSKRNGGPLIVFDCAAAPANTLESELFGHEKGSFTGATTRRIGVIEEADGGTLFLDELGELPLELQPKLLRVLEQRQVRRLGSNRPISVDIRVVAATNRDLARETNAGTFREDLYYRLAVVRLRLPSLRDRRDDIPLLSEHLIRQLLRSDPGRAEALLAGISGDIWQRLQAQPWPGNVRELRNVIERTLVMSGDMGRGEFKPSLTATGVAPNGSPLGASHDDARHSVGWPPVNLDQPLLEQRAELVAAFEKAYLSGMLERNGGKIAPSARAAEIDRMYFKRLMKKRGVV